jgi:hypothetical protein
MMRSRVLLLGVPLLIAACSSGKDDWEGAGADAPITSNEAQIVDFNFAGELSTAKDEDARKAIVGQLFYTVGVLTTDQDANGQVGRVETTDVSETVEGDIKHIKYAAKLPVAWPKGRQVPRSYDVVLPKDVQAASLQSFNAKYDGRCGKNEYGQETFWHDWNPKANGCTIDEPDVVRTSAVVTKSSQVTQDKYPEYTRVWEDGRLEVVAIFGYAQGGAAGDVGGAEYEEFLRTVQQALPGSQQKSNDLTPSIAKDVTISTNNVSVTALLIDTLYKTGPDFGVRYDALSETADLVVYNGHSELSKNTNALAGMGKVAPKKYQVFFFDSCDTYAYLDTALTDRRIAVNGAADDPKGTKYLDVATNVLPSYFTNYAGSSVSLFKALLDPKNPKSYNAILAELPADQVVVVTGEEDNAFQP